MAAAYILMGLPYSGKSTFCSSPEFEKFLIISSDAYIEARSENEGITYNEGFNIYIKDANKHVDDFLKYAIENNKDLIIDRTNLTKKGRKKYIDLLRASGNYEIIGIYFPSPTKDEFERRRNSRPEKVIDSEIIKKMKESMELPDYDDGFDILWF